MFQCLLFTTKRNEENIKQMTRKIQNRDYLNQWNRSVRIKNTKQKANVNYRWNQIKSPKIFVLVLRHFSAKKKDKCHLNIIRLIENIIIFNLVGWF